MQKTTQGLLWATDSKTTVQRTQMSWLVNHFSLQVVTLIVTNKPENKGK